MSKTTNKFSPGQHGSCRQSAMAISAKIGCAPQTLNERVRKSRNMKDLMQQYLPKGTHISLHGAEESSAVAHAPNTRPRKTLD